MLSLAWILIVLALTRELVVTRRWILRLLRSALLAVGRDRLSCAAILTMGRIGIRLA